MLEGYSPSQWDTYKTLATLHSDYQVSPYFRIDVVPYGPNSKNNVVRVRFTFQVLRFNFKLHCIKGGRNVSPKTQISYTLTLKC